MLGFRRTSSESFEFPHPSMSIREALSGIRSFIIGARSAYVLNQSKSLSDSDLNCMNGNLHCDAEELHTDIFDSYFPTVIRVTSFNKIAQIRTNILSFRIPHSFQGGSSGSSRFNFVERRKALRYFWHINQLNHECEKSDAHSRDHRVVGARC